MDNHSLKGIVRHCKRIRIALGKRSCLKPAFSMASPATRWLSPVPPIEWNSSSLRERAFDLVFVGGLHRIVDSDWGSARREPFSGSCCACTNLCEGRARKPGFWLADRRIAESPKDRFPYEHRRFDYHNRGRLNLWDRLQPNQHLHAKPRVRGKVRDRSYLQTGDHWAKNGNLADRRLRSGEPSKNHAHGDRKVVRRTSPDPSSSQNEKSLR
jgi:hypothetical protein